MGVAEDGARRRYDRMKAEEDDWTKKKNGITRKTRNTESSPANKKTKQVDVTQKKLSRAQIARANVVAKGRESTRKANNIARTNISSDPYLSTEPADLSDAYTIGDFFTENDAFKKKRQQLQDMPSHVVNSEPAFPSARTTLKSAEAKLTPGQYLSFGTSGFGGDDLAQRISALGGGRRVSYQNQDGSQTTYFADSKEQAQQDIDLVNRLNREKAYNNGQTGTNISNSRFANEKVNPFVEMGSDGTTYAIGSKMDRDLKLQEKQDEIKQRDPTASGQRIYELAREELLRESGKLGSERTATIRERQSRLAEKARNTTAFQKPIALGKGAQLVDANGNVLAANAPDSDKEKAYTTDVLELFKNPETTADGEPIFGQTDYDKEALSDFTNMRSKLGIKDVGKTRLLATIYHKAASKGIKSSELYNVLKSPAKYAEEFYNKYGYVPRTR